LLGTKKNISISRCRDLVNVGVICAQVTEVVVTMADTAAVAMTVAVVTAVVAVITVIVTVDTLGVCPFVVS